MEEIWKDIKGYEGLYQISNKGQVKSLYREYTLKVSKIIVLEKILKPQKDRLGYQRIAFSYVKGKPTQFLLHRLIAEYFIPNPNNLPVINHIDNNPSNNSIENLEWCTQSHNIQHCFNQGRKPILSGKNNPRSKEIYDPTTGLIHENGVAMAKILNCSINHVYRVVRNEKANPRGLMYLIDVI